MSGDWIAMASLGGFIFRALGRERRLLPRFALCERTPPLEPGQALQAIGEVGHADFDPGAGNAEGADEQPHAVLMPSEHMPDR